MSSMTEKQCFNSKCRQISDKCNRGWRRRTGEYAYLCDRCASAYEDGKFCETFHSNDPGWRCCESCGKKIHCGCIVSFHMFVLLDIGGIECFTCARKSYILTPNPAWPPPSQSEIMKDLSVKNMSQITGSRPVLWHQAPSLPYHSGLKTNVPAKQPFDIDASADAVRFQAWEGPCTSLFQTKEQGSYERLAKGKQRICALEMLGNSGFDLKEQHSFFESISNSILSRNDAFPSNFCLTATSSKTEKEDVQFSAVISSKQVVPSPLDKQVSQFSVDTSGDVQMQCLKYQGDGRSRKSLRYHPQINEEELCEKAVLTPLFEKMLSASDAGRIGRLVLPKKCAEAYFPPIVHPEGFPLNVLDTNGKGWVFQFRFWPNNNSRMYVLEGITPCIQSLQLQAGDIVIFSRLEPKGTLVMGGRKTPATQSVEKGVECTIATTNVLGNGDSCARNSNGVPVSFNCHVRGKVVENSPVSHPKRKCSNLNAKSKRPKVECKNMLKLKFTLKEAQWLIRPCAGNAPSIFIIEGYEFEEFEGDAPVIGWPTYPGIDHSGKEIQWVQCEECFKWRKVPGDALLSSRWVCSDNRWDAGRSLCSAAEEPKDQFEHSRQTSEKDCHPHVCFAVEDEADCVVPASSDSTAKHPSHMSVDRTEMKRCDNKRSESSSVSSICHQSPDKMLGDGNDRDDNTNKWHYLDEVVDRRRQHKSQIDLNIKPDHREDNVQQHSTYSGPSKCALAGEDRFMNASDIVVVNQMQQDVSCSANLI